MTELLSIVLLIFGVLQIILFFKVWSMTNDVKKLKEELTACYRIKYYLSIGDKEKAYKKAVEELYNYLSTQIVSISAIEFLEKTKPTIEKYSRIIEETGHQMPENLSDPQKFWNIWYKKWE